MYIIHMVNSDQYIFAGKHYMIDTDKYSVENYRVSANTSVTTLSDIQTNISKNNDYVAFAIEGAQPDTVDIPIGLIFVYKKKSGTSPEILSMNDDLRYNYSNNLITWVRVVNGKTGSIKPKSLCALLSYAYSQSTSCYFDIGWRDYNYYPGTVVVSKQGEIIIANNNHEFEAFNPTIQEKVGKCPLSLNNNPIATILSQPDTITSMCNRTYPLSNNPNSSTKSFNLADTNNHSSINFPTLTSIADVAPSSSVK